MTTLLEINMVTAKQVTPSALFVYYVLFSKYPIAIHKCVCHF